MEKSTGFVQRILLIISLILTVQLNLFGQSNLKKSLIINAKGDSLQGFVNDRDWIYNPVQFEYKNTPDEHDYTVFNSENAISVQLSGEDLYKSFEVEMSMDEVRLSMLHIRPENNYINKKVFLKVLVEGCRINLYSFTDEIKTRFFFKDQLMDQPKELIYRVYLDPKTEDVKNDKQYIRQLNYELNLFGLNAYGQSKKFNNTHYFKDDLIELATMINGGSNTMTCQSNISNDKFKCHFFGNIGLRISSLEYMDYSNCRSLDKIQNKNISSMPKMSLGFNLAMKSGSRLYFREEIGFSADKLWANQTYEEPLNFFYQQYTYKLNQLNYFLNNSIFYNCFLSNRVKGYLGAGISLFVVQTTLGQYLYHNYGKYEDTYNTLNLDIPKLAYWISYPVSIGCTIKDKIDLNLILFIPMSRTDAGSKLINTAEIGIGYIFN
jgi:hypothetical protein